jgi:hypothetical protein
VTMRACLAFSISPVAGVADPGRGQRPRLQNERSR